MVSVAQNRKALLDGIVDLSNAIKDPAFKPLENIKEFDRFKEDKALKEPFKKGGYLQ